MKLNFKVRSVLLSHESSAVTLEPVIWMRESETETELDDEGNTIPAMVEVEDDPLVEDDVWGLGGKMTELRFDEVTDLTPGDYVTVVFDRTLT